MSDLVTLAGVHVLEVSSIHRGGFISNDEELCQKPREKPQEQSICHRLCRDLQVD